MAQLDHPSIVNLHEVFEDNEVLYLVMELCTGGELLQRLNLEKNHHFSEPVAKKYVKTMVLPPFIVFFVECLVMYRLQVECISYLHEQSIVHRDLKLENFVFEDENSNSGIKLIDFGLSKHFDSCEVLHGAVGTPFYVVLQYALSSSPFFLYSLAFFHFFRVSFHSHLRA